MSQLYDVFVDWAGRLGRELPGIERHLDSIDARRVLDVGCGTGRHVAALLERGLDAHGADASEEMLAQARSLIGAPERLHHWCLGHEMPSTVLEAAPFDAVTMMGNVWPSVLGEDAVHAACVGLHQVLRPGGLLLLGLKAHGVRRGGNPYMPLLRRVHEGRPIWFVRFLDFDVPALEDGAEVCDFHMTIVAGSHNEASADGTAEALHHQVGRHRVWRPTELQTRFEREGFAEVKVSGRLGDPDVAPTTDDVFLSALRPVGN